MNMSIFMALVVALEAPVLAYSLVLLVRAVRNRRIAAKSTKER